MSKPTLKDLQAIVVPKVAAKWNELGIALLCDSPKLEEIHNDYQNCRRCCLEMIRYWLEITPSATWGGLLQALRSPDLELINNAEEIEREIKG